MASSGDVQVVPAEPGVEVEQLALEACCDGGSDSSATTTKEESVMTVLQEQQDTAPEPDHHEDTAAHEQTTTEVSASDEPEEEKRPVATQEAEHKAPETDDDQESTRERLRLHRMEVAGRVWVPEKWGQEKLLKDWVDCTVFDRPLVPAGLLTARRALVAEICTRCPDRTSTASSSAGSSTLRVQNGCS